LLSRTPKRKPCAEMGTGTRQDPIPGAARPGWTGSNRLRNAAFRDGVGVISRPASVSSFYKRRLTLPKMTERAGKSSGKINGFARMRHHCGKRANAFFLVTQYVVDGSSFPTGAWNSHNDRPLRGLRKTWAKMPAAAQGTPPQGEPSHCFRPPRECCPIVAKLRTKNSLPGPQISPTAGRSRIMKQCCPVRRPPIRGSSTGKVADVLVGETS
ncbi:MAG: hypothetical protein RIT14_2654, partial [Pseudomonadota bacterium]